MKLKHDRLWVGGPWPEPHSRVYLVIIEAMFLQDVWPTHCSRNNRLSPQSPLCPPYLRLVFWTGTKNEWRTAMYSNRFKIKSYPTTQLPASCIPTTAPSHYFLIPSLQSVHSVNLLLGTYLFTLVHVFSSYLPIFYFCYPIKCHKISTGKAGKYNL